MKKLTIFLINIFAVCQAFAEPECPPPTELLGHTIKRAQSVLEKRFHKKVPIHGPVCWGNYFTLVPEMHSPDGPATICGGPISAQHLQALVFNDTNQVTSVSYVLPKGVQLETWLAGLSTLIGKIEVTYAYPDSRVFKRRSEHSEPFWKYWSTDRKFFIEATMPEGSDISVTIFDMKALGDQKEALNICFDGPDAKQNNN